MSGSWFSLSQADQFAATSGQLQLTPSLVALKNDYAAMLKDDLLALHQPDFSEIIDQCLAIQDEANRMADYRGTIW